MAWQKYYGPLRGPKIRQRGRNWPDRARIASICRARSALTMRLKPVTASNSVTQMLPAAPTTTPAALRT
eukprot:870696-Alexandrium_andersonii.AAC.1